MAVRALLLVFLPALAMAACSDIASPGGSSTAPSSTSTTPPPPTTSPLACTAAVSTSLPGITARVTNERCDFTLAQAASGIAINYEVTVAADLPPLYTNGGGGYGSGQGTTPLSLVGVLAGNGQNYCLCDMGLPSGQLDELHVPAGTYAGSFTWDGKNWHGPSDTDAREGAAFPSGSYVLTLHGAGLHTKPDAGSPFATDYTVDIAIPVTLTE